MESNDVRAIGICGMGGIGKTTTAKAFYNKYSNKFDVSCFIENEKQHSQGGIPLLSLLNRLLIQLLRRKDYIVRSVESGIRKLNQILCSKKALFVLDDLHQSIYSELLVRLHSLFLAGSRIIITTRDANLLNKLKVEISEVDIYMVAELDEISSLELFSYHAFQIPMPPESFRKLAISFLSYSGGLPLALKVLGSSLRGRSDMSFWKARLEKLRKIPEKEIQKILQLSCDDLDDETQKAMFLYISFFFVGKDIDEAVSIFNSCNFFPEAGIPILIERCLLTVDEDNRFQMHNLIQCMGMELGKSTYMFREDTSENLQHLEGLNKIEGLKLYLTKSAERQIPAKIFEKLPSLRLLEVIDPYNLQHDIKGKSKILCQQMRCIWWHHCPWKYMSSRFCPQKLVSLDMSSSKLKTLWKNPKQIKRLTDLSYLKLASCYNLKQLPEQLGDLVGLKMIDASGTAIVQLPNSIVGLTNLVELKLFNCWKLRKLPKQFGNMKSLRIFAATDTRMEQLPESFACLINLVKLYLSSCTKLTNLPDNIWKLKLLKKLKLDSCSKLERLPEEFGKMQCLEHLDASFTAIKDIPDSIGLLSRLIKLNLSHCKKLKFLPDSIGNLALLTKLQRLSLRCNIRLWLLMNQSLSSLRSLYINDDGQSVSSSKPLSLYKLYNLQYLTLLDCTSIGSSLPQLPQNLQGLWVCNYATLEQLPELSSLKQLKTLDIQRCISLQSIPPLPPQLKRLVVEECPSLQDVANLSMSKELETLSFSQCCNMKEINLKKSFLKVGQEVYRDSLVSANLQNRNIAEWFMCQSNGRAVSFDMPPNMGIDCLALWVVYEVVFSPKREDTILASFTNKTQGTGIRYRIDAPGRVVGEVQLRIICTRTDEVDELFRSGGRIGVLFEGGGNIEVKMYGIHVITKTSSSYC